MSVTPASLVADGWAGTLRGIPRSTAGVRKGERTMVWLLLWCGSGALVGSLLGASIGRVRVGIVLGMFCGVFGWLMLVSARLRERDLASSVADVLAGQRPEFSEDRGLALHE